MIKAYLLDPRTVILAVIPANQDIATVDILERAQSVDPAGERTIGVLTKVTAMAMRIYVMSQGALELVPLLS